jgi:predicted DNA-binding transcriptional regulator YafY
MKIDRLIGIITILMQHEKITAPELAERFEVSRRTIIRDVEDISKAGIPITTIQGYGGGISIADGYKIDKALFTQEEIQTILSGLKGMDSVSKTSYFNKLLDKLSSKGSRVTTDNIIIIDLAFHYQTSLTQKIDIIKQAILGRHIISFKYYYGKGENQRKIEPCRLVFKWSSWYVFGYCLDREAFRMFKLNRLWDVQPTGDLFSTRNIPDEELDFDDYFTKYEIHLKAVFEESEKYRLIEEYSIDCYSTIENGKLLLERNFAGYENMREWILSFGDKVNVLEPEQLRADVQKQAKNILENYKRHDI